MNSFFTDTIIARATPIGEGAIGMIRISGKETSAVLSAIFKPDSNLYSEKIPHKKQILGNISDDINQDLIDSVTVLMSYAPNSYTGEDMAEICTHGNMIIVNRIIDLVLKHNVRIAEPGEFTKRAFLNGKIDLAQAEAVSEIIRSQTDVAQKFALKNLKGKLSDEINMLRHKLIICASEIEARIDFPDDDVGDIPDDKIMGILAETKVKINELIYTGYKARFFKSGANVVIVGKPNTGKSSLFNCLVGMERAIVTPHPGTTRDIIEVMLDIKGIPVKFLDTAGIRSNPEEIESIGIKKTLDEISNTDLIIWLIDSSSDIDQNDRLIYNQITDKNYIIALNKIDLQKIKEGDIINQFGLTEKNEIVKISALKKTGINILETFIYNNLIGYDKDNSKLNFADESLIIANMRHVELLKKSAESVENAILSIKTKKHFELIDIDLRASIQPLDSILGLNMDESIIEQIFNNFCIGK